MADNRSSYRTRKSSHRVLIIEDEWLIVDLIANVVCELGYTVSGTANTLSSARRKIGRRNYDAVLLDIGLDGPHGSEIADRLLQMKVPFGFVTGYDDPFEARHATVPLLHKPFTTVELGELLEKLIGPAMGSAELAEL
jgi:DNA-binding response OmpR family regulator